MRQCSVDTRVVVRSRRRQRRRVNGRHGWVRIRR
jgi:hypothetical protein